MSSKANFRFDSTQTLSECVLKCSTSVIFFEKLSNTNFRGLQMYMTSVQFEKAIGVFGQLEHQNQSLLTAKTKLKVFQR